MIKVCQYCKQEYQTYKSKSKYCSSKCTGLNQSKKVNKICQFCGCEYKVHKYRENTSLFCSVGCRKKRQYLPGFDGEKKICTTCDSLKQLSDFWKGRTKCRECEKKKSHHYYEKNKEKIALWAKRYRTENSDRIRVQRRIYVAENRDQVRKSHKNWRMNNVTKVKLQRVKDEQIRRARKNMAISTLTHKEWMDNLHYFDESCAYCGTKNDLQQEHFIPLKDGGGYEKKNIIPACSFCNRSKGDRSFYEWFEWQAFFSMERAMKIEKFVEQNTEGSPSGNGSEPVESRESLRL